MKRAIVAGSILLISSILAAQSADPVRSSSAILSVAPTASSCPVNLHALQGAGSGMVAVRNAEPKSGPAQHIHLVLNNGNAPRPETGKIVVRGLSDKGQTVPTQLSDSERFDQTRALYVTFIPENEKDVAVDLKLPGFTSVSSIHLESIQYADGSTWKIAGGHVCRVTPDPMMLVAAGN
jgi:hypothetical protein